MQLEKQQGFVCGIFLEKELVGTCGYHPISLGSKEATIGYWLAKSASGKGLVTRATRILIDHGFNVLGLSKINIPVAVGNIPSRAVCERLGLESDGVRKNAEFLYDKYVDHVLYCTSPSKWQP
jgi:ribosomal-protein-serine acetyltransferase